MARKSEVGIEYFPMNTDIIHNSKVKLVVAEFGPETWTVLLPLYCKIYREKGYWIDWYDEDSKLLFAQDECKQKLTFVNELVNGCIRRSLFDKRVFDLFGILTSDRIQENYVIAKSRASNVVLVEHFLLINENVYKKIKDVTVIPITATLIKKKYTVIPQKKKEIIEGEGDSGSPPKHTGEEMNLFKNFQSWISAKAPNVGKMKEPFTIDQYLKLKIDFSSQQIKEMVLNMHNYGLLLKNNVSAYLTFIKWSKKEPVKNINDIPDQPLRLRKL